jgi:hypothetical protein
LTGYHLLTTLIQAGRLFAWRDAPSGLLTSKQVDDVQYNWSSSPGDGLADHLVMSGAPHRRYWAAA